MATCGMAVFVVPGAFRRRGRGRKRHPAFRCLVVAVFLEDAIVGISLVSTVLMVWRLRIFRRIGAVPRHSCDQLAPNHWLQVCFECVRYLLSVDLMIVNIERK